MFLDRSVLPYNKMKTFLSFLCLATLCLLACNRDGIDPRATSQICTEVTGPEAVYWDVRNGIARGDLPGGVPTLTTIGGTFGHPAWPLLGFDYPEGWSPELLTDPSGTTIGVNLYRQDNQAVYRWVSSQAQGFIPVDDVVAFEINSMLGFFNNNAAIEVICRNAATDNSLGNIVRSTSSRLIRVGDLSALVNVQVTYVDGLPSTFISAQMTAGPTVDFTDLIVDVFLPIDWQMLINPNKGALDEDRDGDGVTDPFDNFPDDPNRW